MQQESHYLNPQSKKVCVIVLISYAPKQLRKRSRELQGLPKKNKKSPVTNTKK